MLQLRRLCMNPTRKYVSETRDKFSAPPHPENVADTWNENVDKLKDMYIKMDRTAKKPFITAGVPLTSTYNAIHSPDNTYLRTDKMEEKETHSNTHSETLKEEERTRDTTRATPQRGYQCRN